jgi:transposase InsO family protein
MRNLDNGSKPFEHITVDFVHMKESRTGKKYILTIMDNFSRWLYVLKFYFRIRNSKKIGSDRGVHFINKLFTNFCDQFHISHNIHAAYRPQSSGQLERVHRTLKTTITL